MIYILKQKKLISLCLGVLILLAGGLFYIANRPAQPTEVPTGKPVPIIMYHSILKSAKPEDRYIVSPYALEADLNYLTSHGYTMILMQDLIDYSAGKTTLPEKPIVLTFDDGHFNNYTYVYPLLQKYQGKAVISVVGAYTDEYTASGDKNPNYAYLSWAECKEMSDSGMVEIENHSDDFHTIDANRSGSRRNKSEYAWDYEHRFKADLNALQEKIKVNIGKTATTFTYPFGIISPESVQYVKDLGFSATLSCTEGINYLTGNPEELYGLKRCIRPNNKGVAEILAKYMY